MAQTMIAGKALDPTVISALTAITDGASGSDFLLVWNQDDSTLAKILPDNLGMGAATNKTTYASHGLAVGDVVKSSGVVGRFDKASAAASGGNSAAKNAEVVGIVTAIANTNDLTITISGEIATGGASGFDYADATAGTILFLSATAGLLTATEPTTVGQISKPIAVVTEDDAKIVLIIQRSEIISTGTDTKAPNDAQYVLGASDSALSNGRVLTNGTNTTVDVSTANQIKVNAAAPTFTGVEVSIGAEWGLGRDSSTAATWTQAIHDIVEGSAGTTQWNSSSNQTRIVCKSAGRYYIYGNVALAASNNNGSIELKIKRNGNNIMTQNENGNSESSRHYFGVSRVYNLAVDDYLELFVYQDTSGNRAVQYLVENSIIIAPIFGMYKIA